MPIVDLTIGEPAHGGACVARDEDGRVVFVRHALPGERVRARITSTRNSLAWADAIEILEVSPNRVEPLWPQAGPGGVGGGELSHVAPVAQREWKTQVVAGQLRRVGGEELAACIGELGGVKVLPVPGDEATDDMLAHRRTRIELVIDEDGRPGMHRHRGHEVLALSQMPLAVESITALGLFDEDSPWRELWKPGDRIRIVAPDGGAPVVVIGQSVYDSNRQEIEVDQLEWHVDVGDRTFTYGVRPQGFWQTHVRGAEVLAGAVLEGADVRPGATVMELYSGAGLFSAVLADAIGSEGRLVSLELDESAVADAAENLAPYEWADAFVGDVDAQGIIDLTDELGSAPDVLVLDPPRAGAGRGVCQAIARVTPARIVLVSCDPAAGARDLRTLMDCGYQVESFQAWDLFPHTHHVETVATLARI
nr:TRAM domain-containing protein [Schaalia vaccimaxillae]